MMTLATLLASVMLATLIAYAVLAGADFGAGVWDLLSRGPRASVHRRALAEAIGPVWEANHVWLIFLIVLLFTAFPSAYAHVSVALFWPLHLVLAGVVLRGTSFVFRAYGSTGTAGKAAWGQVFGAASAITPVLLGMCLGAVSTGGGWLQRFPTSTGVLALLVSAYLAAVYLAWEAQDNEIKEDFRVRALATWFAAGAVSIATLLFAYQDAPRLWDALTAPPAGAFVVAGMALAPLSGGALWLRRYRIARVLGAGQIVALLLGWGAAQWPFLVFPDLTVADAAAPEPTLRFIALTLPLGFAVLVPSLWFLFNVFKGRNPHHSG